MVSAEVNDSSDDGDVDEYCRSLQGKGRPGRARNAKGRAQQRTADSFSPIILFSFYKTNCLVIGAAFKEEEASSGMSFKAFGL